jgi:UDP-3-O-[3-hydroxymyristoyl] N-acetylglucosamine deacetylase
MLQRTIREEITFRGLGLHTGSPVMMKLKPAPRDTGVVFYRADKGTYISADVRNVTDTAFATTLGTNGTRVKTVEHILATLSGLGIDNVTIEIDGPEVPILDGSSLEFARRIIEAGIAKQACSRRVIQIIDPIVFREGQTEITAFPYEGRRISYCIQFDHHLLGAQQLTVDLDSSSFVSELAPARTFGFLKDVENLKAIGLAKGGSLDNAVILGDAGVLNASGLRFEDEFIRHKILDFIGDISLIGMPIHAHFVVRRSGHTTNVKFLRHLLAATESWRVVLGYTEALPATA